MLNCASLQEDVLFVKRYKSHKGAVSALEVSATGDMCVSMCLDGTVKVYDVATFDMIVMLRLKFVPGCCAFVSHSRAAQQVLAISDLNDPKIYTFDVSSGSEEPLQCLDAVHQAPVTCMRLSSPSGIVRKPTPCLLLFLLVLVLCVAPTTGPLAHIMHTFRCTRLRVA